MLMMPNKDIDRLDIRVTASALTDCEALRIIYGHDINNPSTAPIRRALFLEYLPLLHDLICNSIIVYSKIPNLPADDFATLDNGYMARCLAKLVESQPMKSYLKLPYRQFVNFIFSPKAKGSLVDMPLLVSYINELRATFSTICPEDRRTLRLNLSHSQSLNLIPSLTDDASFLVNWSVIEAAKYCIHHKFEMSANESILSLLHKETSSKVFLSERIFKLFLLKFVGVIEKLLFDKISETSTGKYTFPLTSSLNRFYKTTIFNAWFAKICKNLARLSLILGDPAECCRSTSLKLQQDLTARYECFNRMRGNLIFNETLLRLDTKDWAGNLHLLVLSAKQLNDLSILKGIATLAGSNGTILDYTPLKSVILNMDGRFEETYNMLKVQDNLEEQSLIEFLDSCIELDLLHENKHMIDKLKSNQMRYLYKTYLDSKLDEQELPEVKLEELNQWLQTWSMEMSESASQSQIQSSKTYVDIILPTSANIIYKMPLEKREEHIECLERLVGEEFLADCLFPPSLVNSRIKIHQLLLNMLKGATKIPKDIVDAHADDLHWNHLVFRTICDLNFNKELQDCDDESINLIQLRAAKYNQKKGNTTRAFSIVENLKRKPKVKDDVRLLCDFITKNNDANSLLSIAQDIKSSELSTTSKCDLTAKVLRHMIKLPDVHEHDFISLSKAFLKSDGNDQEPEGFGSDSVDEWQNLISTSGLSSKIKTLSLFSNRLRNQLESSKASNAMLHTYFKLNGDLLAILCQTTSTKYKSSAIEFGVTLLKLIVSNNSQLSIENYKMFSSQDFILSTLKVWIKLRTNLISTVLHHEDLPEKWADSITKIIKLIAFKQPNLLIYSVIANRLDIQSDLFVGASKPTNARDTTCDLLITDNNTDNRADSGSRSDDLSRKLTIWDELFESIKISEQYENRWKEVMNITEKFVMEMRRISFLGGESLKKLAMGVTKRLHNFLDYVRKVCDKETGVVGEQAATECENRLKSICEQATRSITVLLSRCKDVNLQTSYDYWFSGSFAIQLGELEYRINLLSKKKSPFIEQDLSKLVWSITTLFSVCQSVIDANNLNSRHKMYMETISPMLSRLEPSLIPMPDCCNEATIPTKAMITIHKISQTVDLISSKTSPKKLKFTGSDGIRRSFLLKAHEDTRLDQLIVDLYSTVNFLLVKHKQTKDKFRIRTYSVTPVSSRSGLIQWIEAPSLYSCYKSWLDGPHGKAMVDTFYAETCSSLCAKDTPREQHQNCYPPSRGQTVDIFYQLLWAKTKAFNHPLTETRPSSGNIIKYRSTFDSSIFQDILEQLSSVVPKEIISNHLWYKSSNSYLYWLKTQEFINSCATISMVGYVIGLGDRHLENILLDHDTGEVIHIDQNICFELGKTLSIPEKVPFRLSQNIIHAFGFAGLEGGYTLSCRRVLNVLRESKSTILHLLDPINLNFMIRSSEMAESREVVNNLATYTDTKVDLAKKNPTDDTFELCSQECLDVETVKDIDDLLILQPDVKNILPAASPDVIPARVQLAVSNNLQNDIKTPTKIEKKVAINIYERIQDKLCGTDETIRHFRPKISAHSSQNTINEQPEVAQGEQVPDLIMLNEAQNTDDQVEALILEATALKNKAAMYEGWTAWI